VLYYDFSSGVYTPIVDAGTAGIGHIDSVLVSGDSIFLADFATNGLVDEAGGSGTGAIYEFTIGTPEPSTGLLAGIGLAAILLTVSLRRVGQLNVRSFLARAIRRAASPLVAPHGTRITTSPAAP
jgi:hypothetical protein